MAGFGARSAAVPDAAPSRDADIVSSTENSSLIAADPDNPELDDDWFKRARPASEVLPPEIYAVNSHFSKQLSADYQEGASKGPRFLMAGPKRLWLPSRA